jgi:protein SCO1/2
MDKFVKLESNFIFKKLRWALIIIILFTINFKAYADKSDKPLVRVDEKLGQYLALDAKFIDEQGQTVYLKDLIDVPTIINPVYLMCPNVCNIQLSSLAAALSKLDLVPLKDYKILTISFNDKESYKLAREKKNNYIEALNQDFPEEAWKFLVGDSENIKKFVDSIGYMYVRKGMDFLHPVTLVFVTKEGKIVRYLYGTNILPFDLTLAINEAHEGHVGTSVKRRILDYCFTFDENSNKYSINILRISAVIIIIFIIIIFLVLMFGGKKRSKK